MRFFRVGESFELFFGGFSFFGNEDSRFIFEEKVLESDDLVLGNNVIYFNL